MNGKSIALFLAAGLAVLGISGVSRAATISLTCDVNQPCPGDEVTIWVQTDSPLNPISAVGVFMNVVGDVNILPTRFDADCNTCWGQSYIEEPADYDGWGWVQVGGIVYPDPIGPGNIGFFKFTYNSGQVSIWIDSSSLYLGTPLQFSSDVLAINPADVNECMNQSLIGRGLGESSQTESEPNSARQFHLVYCPPADTNGFPADMNGFPADSNAENLRSVSSESLSPPPCDIDNLCRDMFNKQAVDIYSDITSNQVWTQDNLYIVHGYRNVQSLLVIEPNTMIQFDFDNGGELHVNNGGTLISCGEPNKIIKWTTSGHCDCDEIGQSDYESAIVVEETASPATRIEYNVFWYADKAVVIKNNRLDNPIENNGFDWNKYGILEYGPKLTDIVNNNFGGGIDTNSIEVHMASENGVADANSYILIENNTCFALNYTSPYYGIVVHGVSDENKAGKVAIANNVISQCVWYGLSLVDGWIAYDVYNNGYYGNGWRDGGGNYHGGNKYPTDLEEDNAVVTSVFPFVVTQNWWSDYLNPGCPFIDAGWQYIEETGLIGMTTDANGTPDSNKVDLGYHFPSGHICCSTGWPWEDWNYTNAGVGVAKGDINKDAVTDLLDLQALCHSWLQTVSANDPNNLYNSDTTVNFKDYAILAKTWFKIQGHPNISVGISGNPANLSGNVDVNAVNFGAGAMLAFLMVDGEYFGQIADFAQGYSSLLETPALLNGQHKIKIVTMDYNYNITVSPVLNVDCNNLVYSAIANEYFQPTESYKYSGLCSSTGSLTASLTNSAGQSIWSNTISASNVNVTIPGSSFGSEQLCKLSLANASTSTKKTLAKSFNAADAAGKQMAIILPNSEISDLREDAIHACINACDLQHVTYIIVRNHDVTPVSLSAIFSNNPSVKYVYWCGHGNDHVGAVPRTQTFCWQNIGSSWWSNWQSRPVLSYTTHTVPDARPLPYGLDDSGFDLSSLGMRDSWNKKIVFIDGCLTATFPDMAEAYGVFSLQGQGSLDQIYIGWRKVVEQGNVVPVEQFLGDTTKGVMWFWQQLGYGSSVWQALVFEYDNSATAGGRMWWTFWGPDVQMNVGDDNGDDYFFVRSLRGVNLNTIKLEH